MGVPQPAIRPRSDWAAGLPARSGLQPETDVRFLLVHHTASANVGADQSVAQLRSFFTFHTSPEKGWPDIAYNFLVDSGGQIWEGRTGSLAGPVQADATGGSQGFAQLCCFIGDFSSVSPTPEAIAAMTHLLAWLSERYAVSLVEGATVTFTSRGSSRWPAGANVTAATISGHRDMSQTSCPGDTAYALLETTFRPGARALVASHAPTPSPSPTTSESESPNPSSPSEATTPTSEAPSSASPSTVARSMPSEGAADEWVWPATAGGILAAAGLAGLGWVLRRRTQAEAQSASRRRQAR